MSWRDKLLASWQQPAWFTYPLLPVSWVYSGLLKLDKSLKFQGRKRAPIPTIVVGNLTVGGSGKTPLVIYVVELLKQQGLAVGVASRGYKADTDGESMILQTDTPVDMAGDEPFLIKRRTSVPVVIGANRHASITLLQQAHKLDVVVCDDGLQHWPLAADIEICLLDTTVKMANPYLLPAGPWRESQARLQSIDMVVEHGMKQDSERRFGMQLQASEPVPLQVNSSSKLLSKRVHAVAGIGQPQRFFNTCRELGYEVIEHAFPDHYTFTEGDLDFGAEAVLMTEKDAVKCLHFAQDNHWYLPVSATLSPIFDAKLQHLLASVRSARSNQSYD